MAMPHNLSSAVLTVRVMNGVVAGQTNQTTAALDTRGYDAVRFIVALGAVTDGTASSIKAQQSTDDASTDSYADIAGTAQTILDADDNKLRIIEIYRPEERYLKVVITRATQNVVIDGVFAELYRAADVAVTQDASVAGLEQFNHPTEGTA